MNQMSAEASETIVAVPMHGESKLRREGLRTRDGHILEWISTLRPSTQVLLYSRPEPWPRVSISRFRGQGLPRGWQCVSPQPIALPPLLDWRRWWVKSNRYARPLPKQFGAAVVWNPTARPPQGTRGGRILFDLLDNWLIHPSFASIRAEVTRGYKEWFELADVVVANSEGTLELAHSLGRTDAVMLPNGCDPERFSSEHRPGERFTLGYGGKLSERLDLELVEECAERAPEAVFEFVGPAMSRYVRRALGRLPNVRCVGDVPYPRYPQTFVGWDAAWAPHRLGAGEIGGDLIKLYEYRAAGLPTISTRVIGWERALPGVRALPRSEIPAALEALSAQGPGSIERDPVDVPPEHTWQAKAEQVLKHLHM